MRNFCSSLWNEKICCKVFNEMFLLQIVEGEVFAANCGMRRFCSRLWNEKFLLQSVE